MRGRTGLLLLCAALLGGRPTVSAAQDSLQVFVVIYSRGSAWIAGRSPFEQQAVHEHIMHHENLAARLLAAAPFATDSADRTVGMVVMLAASERDAKTWAANDPMIINGAMTARVYRWHVGQVKSWSRR